MKIMKEQSTVYKDVALARTGVYDYLGSELGVEPANKVFKVCRLPGDYSEAFLDSLRLVPLLNEHHEGIEGASENKIGAVGEFIRLDDDGFVRGNVAVFDLDAYDAIRSNKRELSLGFTSELHHTPGVYDGVHYDIRQVPLHAEHVALVERGRAGSEVRLNDHRAVGRLFFDKCSIITEKEDSSMDIEQRIAALEATISELAGLVRTIATPASETAEVGDMDVSIVDPEAAGEMVAEEVVADVVESVVEEASAVVETPVELTEQEAATLESAVSEITAPVAEVVAQVVEAAQTAAITEAAVMDAFRKENKAKATIAKTINAYGVKFTCDEAHTVQQTRDAAIKSFCAHTKIPASMLAGRVLEDVVFGMTIEKNLRKNVTRSVTTQVADSGSKTTTSRVECSFDDVI